jgi:glycosyltransferase involved in cell wall biosynthesis
VRILFLTQIIPYPPDSGPKVKTWHVLRYLAEQGHQISLASFVRPDEQGYVTALHQVCAEVRTVPIHRSRLADAAYWLRSQVTRRPFLIERDDLPGMRECVHDLMALTNFDYIHADQLSMAQFALPAPALFARSASRTSGRVEKAPRLVFDAHNAVWTIVERMSENVPFYLKPIATLEARRVKRYEGMLLAEFDHTLVVTEIDQDMLLEAVRSGYRGKSSARKSNSIESAAVNSSVTIIPIAVDTQILQPIVRQPGSMNIVTLGTLHYPPNADGIRWFAREVFPLVLSQVPAATLTIIGKNPPADFQELAASQPDKFSVTGYVPQLEPYLERAALMVVPVRAGSGMRVRILDAFAHAMPIITTTVGLEGIDAIPGQDVLVADSVDDFARSVVSLLRDESLQKTLAERGRGLAEARYDWRVVLTKLDEVYGKV